jgi:hypothetical protein
MPVQPWLQSFFNFHIYQIQPHLCRISPLSLLPRRQRQIHICHNHRKSILRFLQQLPSIFARSKRDVKRHYQSRYHGSQLDVCKRFADTTPEPKREWDKSGLVLDQLGTTIPAFGDEFEGSDVGFWCYFGCQCAFERELLHESRAN